MKMNISAPFMDETFKYICNEIFENYVPEYFKDFGYTPWIFSLLGSALIGLSGILPLFVIPIETGDKNSEFNPAESKSLKILLSFAVGGLLGDVFLHLLPEAWSGDTGSNKGNVKRIYCADHPSLRSGLWVLSGILIFTIVEKVFSGYVNQDESNPQPKCVNIANCLLRKRDGKLGKGDTKMHCTQNGSCDIEDVPNSCFLAEKQRRESQPQIKIAGYLNLMANSIDNFTHGLAVAVHEIPHEVGDFAILLKSGFSRWDAARAQLLTAGAGLLGALVAIGGSGVTSAMEARTSWIMPFTAGGFLHIALVTVLPDLIKETDLKESIKQIAALIFGIAVMAIMTVLFE
ncbi:Zinc transporter ZIP13 like [Pseudolycoriella hygida]|uniref:Zinc transporter ZIP13 like n=1 Tax=Pseudolycoriella hygida TaxID=35572 RepID=A0A9Q0MXM5_9DIPT|nr:Zinc transporter ZIP13 like [Pseudolycoriella hygida]